MNHKFSVEPIVDNYFVLLWLGKLQKKSFFSGLATKRGGGLKATEKKELILKIEKEIVTTTLTKKVYVLRLHWVDIYKKDFLPGFYITIRQLSMSDKFDFEMPDGLYRHRLLLYPFISMMNALKSFVTCARPRMPLFLRY